MLIAHTADLDTDTLAAARALLYDVFVTPGDEMTEDDWEHCLGGIHAVVREGDAVIAHAAVVQRRLVHRGRALRCGYVEGVAVRADRRRQGHGAAVMEAVERVIRAAFHVGALGSTDEAEPFYESRGWRRWAGPTSALTPSGLLRTEDADGGIFVLACDADLDFSAALTCDWREGDVW